jgi:hypothetical protein
LSSREADITALWTDSADALLLVDARTKANDPPAWTGFEHVEETSESLLELTKVFLLTGQLSLHFAETAPLRGQALSVEFDAPVEFDVSRHGVDAFI